MVSPLALFADSGTDRKIERAAAASYNFRVVLDNRVKTSVRDGVVTLTGMVADPDQKTLAENTVRGLPGVVAVENRLEVEFPGATRTDNWIALKARSSLLVHANVSATSTEVAVRDGNVTLTGTAESVAQKELTEAYVRDIDGVKSVKNKLVVSTASAPSATAPERSLGERIDDTSITAQVKYALLTHRSTSALRTNVDTLDGVVVIRGQASSDAEKDLVTKLARGIKGVASVSNEMTVRAAE